MSVPISEYLKGKIADYWPFENYTEEAMRINNAICDAITENWNDFHSNMRLNNVAIVGGTSVGNGGPQIGAIGIGLPTSLESDLFGVIHYIHPYGEPNYTEQLRMLVNAVGISFASIIESYITLWTNITIPYSGGSNTWVPPVGANPPIPGQWTGGVITIPFPLSIYNSDEFENGDVYHSTNEEKSYLFYEDEWYVIAENVTILMGNYTEDREELEIIWKGVFSAAPENPEQGWVYRNVNDKKSFVWFNDQWIIIAQDEVANGRESSFVNWLGSFNNIPVYTDFLSLLSLLRVNASDLKYNGNYTSGMIAVLEMWSEVLQEALANWTDISIIIDNVSGEGTGTIVAGAIANGSADDYAFN